MGPTDLVIVGAPLKQLWIPVPSGGVFGYEFEVVSCTFSGSIWIHLGCDVWIFAGLMAMEFHLFFCVLRSFVERVAILADPKGMILGKEPALTMIYPSYRSW